MERDGHRIASSNPDKPMFAAAGITKGDVVAYYDRVGEHMLPQVGGRPLVLERFPDGVDAGGFFQKNTPEHVPDWIGRVEIPTRDGGSTSYAVVEDVAGLVYLAEQATIVFHTLLARAGAPSRPVEVVFDLDPADDDLGVVRATARHLREILVGIGHSPRVKSSGSRGLHVHTAVDAATDFDHTRAFAREVAEAVVRRTPDDTTTAQRKAERHGRLFIDVLRNGSAAHAVAPYSLRARPGAPVAAPLDWDEALDRRFHPRRLTIHNLFRRLGHKADPWAGQPTAGPLPPPGRLDT